MAPAPRIWIPTLLGAPLYYATFFPMNLGWLAWVALIPWFMLVRADKPKSRSIYAACFLGSLIAHVGLIQWMRVAHPMMYFSWLFLAFYCAVAQCMALFCARRMTKAGLPIWLSGSIAIIAFDYFKAHFPVGFSWLEPLGVWHPIGFGWYAIGHTQHDSLSLIQIADVTGVYGVTFLVVLINGVLFESLCRVNSIRAWMRTSESSPTSLRAGIVTAIVLIVISLGYGQFRLRHEAFEEGPDIAIIQGNLPQDLKNDRGEDMYDHFFKLCDQAVNPGNGMPKPDLVVWPETSYAGYWFDLEAGVNINSAPLAFQREYNLDRRDMKILGHRWNTPMLYGINRLELAKSEREWKYNSALLFDENGDLKASYDKIHLVPLGEYVPLVEQLPFLRVFSPYEGDYGCKRGTSFTKFRLPSANREYTFGCLICYEDSDAALGRRYVAGPEPVNFMVDISNDGWFDGTEEHEEHFAIARFRAIETRRALVRSVNMGISAIVDPDGRVISLPAETWKASKKVTAILRARIPIGTQSSPYAVIGDWMPIGAWLTMLFLVIRRLVKGKTEVVPSNV